MNDRASNMLTYNAPANKNRV